MDGPTRMATPANPIAIPTTARRGNRSPRKIPARIATQTGISPTRSAAIPDGTVCSPKATSPFPPPRSNAPTMALSRHSRRVGRTNERPSRAIDQAKRMAPANKNRAAAMRNGGIVSTAIAIPRYVEPHTR